MILALPNQKTEVKGAAGVLPTAEDNRGLKQTQHNEKETKKLPACRPEMTRRGETKIPVTKKIEIGAGRGKEESRYSFIYA